MNLISILVGLVALIAALVAFIPLLGWMYWLIIPIAIVGFAIGQFSKSSAGRNLNLLVIVVGAVRLSIGGGIF
ncbi:hypothetical protein [Sphingomonas montanisoli]|uniref:Uncharacterized protein n=1 Tax=Sphingomonas montanisoli TaxID=2606412 RepID=A0A5D9C5E9_9SPHN|nr:hypothetical protein [Sphingomonas montanisoli]TZG26467.1 hypothetical protein FYJ91_16210 [Sphingomonas montanisoli]